MPAEQLLAAVAVAVREPLCLPCVVARQSQSLVAVAAAAALLLRPTLLAVLMVEALELFLLLGREVPAPPTEGQVVTGALLVPTEIPVLTQVARAAVAAAPSPAMATLHGLLLGLDLEESHEYCL